ncbi:hypothetical protein HY732_01405 [Candidatus Uhrbacteria bacterium]|nr:hypothetical protein [Candidatus Uhrbacteria bacterium]
MTHIDLKNRYSIAAGLLVCVFGVFVVAYYWFSVKNTVGTAVAIPRQEEAIIFSTYEGTFLTWNNNYFRVKLTKGGIIGGFITDKNTEIVEGPFVQGQSQGAVRKKISDIPQNGRLTFDVIEDKTSKSSIVHRIIYYKD